MMEDKCHDEFLQTLIPLIDTLIITQPHMERAAMVDVLRQEVPSGDCIIKTITDPWDAYCQALQVAGPSDIICVTGSLFLVGEILEQLIPPHSSLSES